jgi:chromate reductase, NAD(P)H dehydrogenase (quinone)
MEKKIKVLAFAGSLRKGSYNKALIRVAVEEAPPTVTIEVYDLEGIPLFNQEFESNPPAKIVEFNRKSVTQMLCLSPPPNTTIQSAVY